MMQPLRIATMVATFFMLFLPALLRGQVTGDLRGTIVDTGGGAIPGARVTLTSLETGETRQTTSDAAGRFAFNLLRTGTYEVKAEAAGFSVATTEGQVRTGEITAVVLPLEVGQVTETITVTDAVSQLDVENAQIQVSVNERAIQEVPVQRNPNLFAATAPGVIPVSQNNPFLGSGSFNSNGGRGRGNNVTVDNIVATDLSVTGTSGVLSVLNFVQIKEVKLITNNFSAEYGRNANSQMMYITKSGTNEFHGEAFEFFRNDKLNARQFLDRSGQPNIVRYNEYGFGVGGPIFRNRTFFYGAYQGLKRRGASAPVIAQVPTPAMIAQVTDPTARALLDQYQLPAPERIEGSTGFVTQSAGATNDDWGWSIRIDHQITRNNTVTGRYSEYTSEAGSASLTFIGSNLANFGATSTNKPIQLSLSDTHVFSPTIVNEARFAYSESLPEFPINSTAPLGSRIQFLNGQVASFGVWEGFPQGRAQKPYQFSDVLSIVRGAHTFKAGVDAYFYRAPSFFDALQRPVIRFANWDDFAVGRPTQALQRFGDSVRNNEVNNHFYFFQDDWKVNRNLTLNLGVRVEVAGGPNERDGLISNLNLDCREPFGAGGAGPFGCLETGRPAFGTNVNWAPRFGFAWTPFNDLKTVVRGGYGIAYDFIFMNPITNQRFLPPFIVQGVLTGTASFTGNNSLASIVAGTSDFQREFAALAGQFNPATVNFGSIVPAIDQGLRNPQVHQFNLGIQRELMPDLVVKANYVGTKSNFLQRSRALNLVNDPRAAPATSLADETARLADFQAAQTAAFPGSTTLSNRIDGRYNEISLLDSSANSNYHALQLEADKRFNQGYFLRFAYTWSKSIDDISDALGVLINDSAAQQDPRNNRNNRGASQFDVRHRAVITHQWEPTWGRDLSNPVLRHMVHGWGFSGVSSFRSGFPVSFVTGPRRGIAPITVDGQGAAAPVRPNVAGPFEFNPRPSGSAGAPSGTDGGSPVAISTYAASLGLSQPLIGNIGTLGRGTHRLDNQINFDWMVYRHVPITERVRLQFRCEMYNAFNSAYFQDVQANISNPGFGQYTTTVQDSRFLQLGLRVIF
jgi:hypothetical protein